MPERPVVCNTSPLIKLAGVGLLNLLPQIYGTIWVPEIVRDEYLTGATAPTPDLTTFLWLVFHQVTIAPTLQALSGFGAGEAAAITLAEASHARIILLDDKRARRVAHDRGLTVVGTLGVLVRAKQQGYLTTLRPVLTTMMAQGRYSRIAIIGKNPSLMRRLRIRSIRLLLHFVSFALKLL